MKIAISTDNHFDVNKISVEEALAEQAAFLLENQIDVYVNAGDSFNDFDKTIAFYDALQARLGNQTIVRWIAGNHDMVNHADYERVQGLGNPLYLHEKILPLPDDTVIIGNNGWYDYSLAPVSLGKTPDEFASFKRAFWIDSAIDQPLTDKERMARVLITTERDLTATQGKRVIYVTHFVPIQSAVPYAPGVSRWQMSTGLLGSKHLGELLERHAVADVVFGHVHLRDDNVTRGVTTYHHTPMGYGIKRRFEWRSESWFKEWVDTLVLLDTRTAQ